MSAKTTTSIKRFPSQDKNAAEIDSESRGVLMETEKMGADKIDKARHNYDMPYLLSVNQVCSLLNIGKSTLYTLVGKRELLAVKVLGRTLFKPADIDNFINNLPEYEGGTSGF